MWRSFSRRNDDVTQILDSLDLPGVAKYIKSDNCKQIFIMAGAGISTSAGIPDFRSPDTGLYANLARLNLPYPEAVFDISFFQNNPRPFYVLAHELAPGKYRPTLTHSFIRLLAEKNLLHTCFTQNIDTLERRAGVPPSKIIEAHGSFADQHCVNCGAHYPHDEIKKKIEAQEIPLCVNSQCKGYVKPDIVFFGESLPSAFFTKRRNLLSADLLIVMGTSLTVHPFASLTELVPDECPRLLINLEHVGGWGARVNDVACLMPCDKAVRQLCGLLGWEEDLDKLWAETVLLSEDAVQELDGACTIREGETNEELLDGIVEKMADTIGAIKIEDDPQKEVAENESDVKGEDEVTGDDIHLQKRPEEYIGDEAVSKPEEQQGEGDGQNISGESLQLLGETSRGANESQAKDETPKAKEESPSVPDTANL